MIISELRKNTRKNNNDIAKVQRCTVECDKCTNIYETGYSNILRSRLKYEIDLCPSCRQCLQYSLGLRNKQKEFIGKYATNVQKGKKLEELYTSEKVIELKNKFSIRSSGENNPNFGGKYSRGFADRPKLGKWKDRFSSETIKTMRENLSIKMSGKNNPMYGKPSPQGSGNGWSGWYEGHFFRSLLELSYLKYLIDNNINFESAEKAHHKIKYQIDENDRTYYPDFYLIDSKTYIEVKPKSLINAFQNVLKFTAAINKHGEAFKIITDEEITKLSIEEIKELYKNNRLKFIDRYELKFKEKYL